MLFRVKTISRSFISVIRKSTSPLFFYGVGVHLLYVGVLLFFMDTYLLSGYPKASNSSCPVVELGLNTKMSE
jgi:hypothetical protein